MHLLLVTDTFPPLNNSGAVQLWDLALGFQDAGHQLTVMVASPHISSPWIIEVARGVKIVRVRTMRLKEVSHIKRSFGELMMPLAMLKCLRSPALQGLNWDGLIWYSPSIFFGPLIHYLKKKNGCKAYLIIRDIFPEWAFDMGLIKNRLVYFVLKRIAKYQYSLADTIGIQTLGNEKYFLNWRLGKNRQLEVLRNWITPSTSMGCSLNLSKSSLAGRFIFIYAGNMGVAQHVETFLDLAFLMRGQDKIGFLFVGRGSQLELLKSIADTNSLDNTLFYDEIASSQIPALFAQCHVGLIALDGRHHSHNIPGKFLTYLAAGLPVLAQVNSNNDIIKIIEENDVGMVNISCSPQDLLEKANQIIDQIQSDIDISERCQRLANEMFSTKEAVARIMNSLSN